MDSQFSLKKLIFFVKKMASIVKKKLFQAEIYLTFFIFSFFIDDVFNSLNLSLNFLLIYSVFCMIGSWCALILFKKTLIYCKKNLIFIKKVPAFFKKCLLIQIERRKVFIKSGFSLMLLFLSLFYLNSFLFKNIYFTSVKIRKISNVFYQKNTLPPKKSIPFFYLKAPIPWYQHYENYRFQFPNKVLKKHFLPWIKLELKKPYFSFAFFSPQSLTPHQIALMNLCFSKSTRSVFCLKLRIKMFRFLPVFKKDFKKIISIKRTFLKNKTQVIWVHGKNKRFHSYYFVVISTKNKLFQNVVLRTSSHFLFKKNNKIFSLISQFGFSHSLKSSQEMLTQLFQELQQTFTYTQNALSLFRYQQKMLHLFFIWLSLSPPKISLLYQIGKSTFQMLRFLKTLQTHRTFVVHSQDLIRWEMFSKYLKKILKKITFWARALYLKDPKTKAMEEWLKEAKTF